MEEILHHVGGIKPGKEWDKLPFSTGFHTGFLNHQLYHQLLPSVLPVLQGARFGIKTRQLLGVGLQETTWSFALFKGGGSTGKKTAPC